MYIVAQTHAPIVADRGNVFCACLSPSEPSMRLSFSLALLAVSVFCSQAATVTLVHTNAPWKYLDDGSDQGTAWQAPAFDDSSWSNGVPQLGYGDNDETTPIRFGPDEQNKYI